MPAFLIPFYTPTSFVLGPCMWLITAPFPFPGESLPRYTTSTTLISLPTNVASRHPSKRPRCNKGVDTNCCAIDRLPYWASIIDIELNLRARLCLTPSPSPPPFCGSLISRIFICRTGQKDLTFASLTLGHSDRTRPDKIKIKSRH